MVVVLAVADMHEVEFNFQAMVLVERILAMAEAMVVLAEVQEHQAVVVQEDMREMVALVAELLKMVATEQPQVDQAAAVPVVRELGLLTILAQAVAE